MSTTQTKKKYPKKGTWPWMVEIISIRRKWNSGATLEETAAWCGKSVSRTKRILYTSGARLNNNNPKTRHINR